MSIRDMDIVPHTAKVVERFPRKIKVHTNTEINAPIIFVGNSLNIIWDIMM